MNRWERLRARLGRRGLRDLAHANRHRCPGHGALLKEAIEERLVEDERVSDVVDLSAPEITYPEVSFRVARGGRRGAG